MSAGAHAYIISSRQIKVDANNIQSDSCIQLLFPEKMKLWTFRDHTSVVHKLHCDIHTCQGSRTQVFEKNPTQYFWIFVGGIGVIVVFWTSIASCCQTDIEQENDLKF